MTKQMFSGSYLIDGTAFTQRLAIEIESITSQGAYYGRTDLNSKVVHSKGTWNTRTFHNEWQGGAIDGIVSSDTSHITGVIRIGIKTGSVTLTIQSSHTLGEE
jgi:hypothetical protein